MIKSSHVTTGTHTFQGQSIMHALLLFSISKHTKLDMPSFIHSKDIVGP